MNPSQISAPAAQQYQIEAIDGDETRVRKPRPANERELRTLRTMLEASIALDEPGFTELSAAVAEHKASRKRTIADTGERHRAAELREREGWAWLRPFRRLDEFELAVKEAKAMERERERRGSPEREFQPA